ncbi:MAG: hypothetical protein HYZ34_12545 [Ignavibacteriae bacterium]|nr:hypothetical protein [Ignavibacteriota bacterium]
MFQNTAKHFVYLLLFVSLHVLSNAQTPEYPFPQHVGYTAGTIKPNHVMQSTLDDSVRSFYEQWKSRYLVAGCGINQYYVFYNYEGGATPPDAICVSEGQGYGMLLTAYMAGFDDSAKIYFDGLYNYYRAHPSDINNRLMAWRQRTGCISGVGERNSATDGDVDIAYALLVADNQWRSGGTINYKQEALTLLDAIMQDEINQNLFSVKLGDWSNSSEPSFFNSTRSSDFMLNHFKLFAEITGDTNWSRIANTCYDYISAMQANYSTTTGLIPDFITNLNTTPAPAHANFLEGSHDGHYYYNACRDPWRIGVDYLLTGDTRALTVLNKINSWLKTATSNNPANIRPGYQLNGTAIHTDYSSMAFTAPFAVGAMVHSSNQQWLNDLWDEIVGTNINAEGYYENSLKLLCMLTLSGNWWNPVSERTISFSGYEWSVKNSESALWGPGPNYFSESPSNVWVDSFGRLHLKITGRNNLWQCSEVILNQTLGYGYYVFHLAENSAGQMNENGVLGLFTWDDTAVSENYREIDIEFAKWGNAGDPTNAQFVVQPWNTPGNLVRWTFPLTAETSAHWFDWQADSITFGSVKGTNIFPPYDSLITSWKYTGEDIPSAGTERVHLNLWLINGLAPTDSQEIEIIVSKFEFNPEPPSVAKEWRIVSVPRRVADARKTALFPGTYSDAFSFNQTNGYEQQDTLQIGVGYWLKFAVGQEVPFSGDAITEDTIEVVEGWNLVGSISNSIASGTILSVPPGIITSPFFGYNRGYASSEMIEPGKGYWVKVSQNGVVILR